MKMKSADEQILQSVSSMLTENKLTIATAESCTGGLIAHSLTNISGSSDFFERGIVSYSNQAKIDLLSVSEEMLNKYGAVSEPIAKAMAEDVRKKSNVDIGISITGIAGPTGGTPEKPVGLVFIGLSTKTKTVVKKFQFKGSRLKNKHSTCNAALNMLYDYLKKLGD
jgi:nicotinamide-nucleotide amidase